MEGIIIIILWATCSLLTMIQYAPFCSNMPIGNFLLAGTIFIIGGPFFAIVSVLETMLDIVMPEGWDSDSGPRM